MNDAQPSPSVKSNNPWQSVMQTLPPGYKQTELGLIPKEWKLAEFDALGSVIDGDRGTNYPSSKNFSESGHCLFLNAGNVTKDGFRFSECAFITAEKDEQLGKGHLKRNDIVLTTRGTVGNLAYFDAAVPFEHMRINSGMVILRNESSGLNTNFLYTFLQSHFGQSQIARLSFGSAQPQLTVKGISKLRIVIPGLSEQQAIAKALSDVDALISALDRLIAKKRLIKQGAMQELLIGKKRLPEFGEEWVVKRLGDLADLKNGYAFKSSTYNPLGQFNIITIANVQDGYMDLSEGNRIDVLPSDIQSHHKLQLGDVLISMTGNVGRVCQVSDTNCLLNQRVGKLIPLQIASGFLFALLGQRRFLTAMTGKAKGGAQGNLSVADITEFQFTIPPTEEEQTAIATILSDMDAEIAALEQRRDKTRLVKQGMMQELLTGRTRLL